MSKDRYFTRDGATIAYQYTGTGAPLGYAHGVFLSRDAVRRMELFDFDALSAGRSLLTFDQRGHGRSTGRPVVTDYTFANVALDLLGALDAAGVDEPIDFAGSSHICRATRASRRVRAGAATGTPLTMGAR